MKKNNKIGIITYHSAINLGASLQAYALNKYINNQGIECETIDYHTKKIDSFYNLIKFDFKNINVMINSIIGIKDNIEKKIKFKKFNKNIKLSKEKYNQQNIKRANNKYDIFITGSDQVWNLDLNDDKNYYLDFVKNNSKNSYAASFGNINIMERYNDFLKNSLEKFNIISVREESAKIRLKEKFNIDSSLVLDPTFLLNQKDWDDLNIKKQNKEEYILLYVMHEETAYKIAERLSNLLNLRVFVINQSYRKRIKAKYIRNTGPKDFISLIKNSKYVITDSFHGTALSIIYRKNLKVILKNKNKHLNDRLNSILKLFKLESCITDISTTDDVLTDNTDYSQSENIINNEIEKSKEILNRIIYK